MTIVKTVTLAGWLQTCIAALSVAVAADTDWQPLFDGKSLAGWKANEHPGSFKVVDGAIAADGDRSHLFYVGSTTTAEADFRDFELHAEVKSLPGANSGLYFHTAFQDKDWPAQGFEVQINNSQPKHGDYLENKKTGSLYGIRNVYKALVPDGEWFNVDVSVRGKQVQIRLNSTLVVDYTEATPPAVPAGAEGRVLGHGTFALQCHDPASKVFFRNLRVRRLPAAAAVAAAPAVDGYYRQVLKLGVDNFPLVDFHIHLKGGLTLEEALQLSRKNGIMYGIAPNCGVGFSITNDAGIYGFLEQMKGQPIFLGMQAEGREWVKLFTPAAIARFDYVFSDSMTFTDDQGRRTRLWMKNEVQVDDPEKFMNTIVERTVGVLSREPIDIYVNPTFLPEVMAADYDKLWTEARMQKVIEAAARNGVAIEINSRYKLPSAKFIKLAKQAGVKFSFGTNNGDRDLGRCEYALDMVRECGLTWQDMFMPKPDGRKPVQVKGLPK